MVMICLFNKLNFSLIDLNLYFLTVLWLTYLYIYFTCVLETIAIYTHNEDEVFQISI